MTVFSVFIFVMFPHRVIMVYGSMPYVGMALKKMANDMLEMSALDYSQSPL